MNDIVLICDENYVLPTEVMIYSIGQSAIKYNFSTQVHICSCSLSESCIARFQKLNNEKMKIDVVVVDMDNYKIQMNQISQNSHVTVTALLKFELPNIFAQLDQLLYLDSDMVVNGNLQELFEQKLANNLLAASFEFWKYQIKLYQYCQNDEVPEFYFNSGVMLLNLKKFREEGITEKLWRCKIEQFNKPKDGKFSLMDQDVFNEVCGKSALQIPIRYNCNTRFTHDVNVANINKAYHITYRNIEEIKKDAVILHFVGKEDKPWVYLDVSCQDIWDDYYVKLGRNPFELKRKKLKHNIGYYLKQTGESIKVRGIVSTVKYILEKIY